MSQFQKILKNNLFDLLIIFLLSIINLFWLPTFSFWSIYPKNNFIVKNNELLETKSPVIPLIKLTSKPALTAPNYILVDVDTNKILLSQNINQRIFPASTTKLATALTALNLYPLDEVVTVNQEYLTGKVMNLKLHEKITVKSLVSALLVYSANDSAYTLANHYQSGSRGFIDQMNLLMTKHNLNNTHFTNVDGVHDNNHYSTVYDLSQLARLSIKNSIVTNFAKTKELVVSDVTNEIKHPLVTTNELLGIIPEINGLKTGWTPEAKGVFIGLIDINGHSVISVVSQSEDRFQDTKILIDWLKQNVSWGE